MEKNKLDYAAAGVDIEAADRAVEKIKKLAKATFNKCVLSEIGSFGGFFQPDLTGYKEPVLISSADGVGTKLKIAFMTNKHDTVGEDLVNHCVNDILVHGARPLFFMDYIGTGKLDPDTVAEIITGFSRGCKNHDMALLGGETAEMPDFYAPGEYDLAGFIVGMVDKAKIVNGADIQPGDSIIGLAAGGLHTNGYSLARKIAFDIAGLKPDTYIDTLKDTIGAALLKTHKSYFKIIWDLLKKYEIKGMAHITGGGIPGNLVRILPENTQAIINKGSWDIPPIFTFLAEKGPVAENDMYPAFNMGIGYILVVKPELTDKIIGDIKKAGERAYILGRIEKGSRQVILKG